LTPLAIERMKPPATGQVEVFDRGYPGLSLRVSYGGSRTWSLFYRSGGKLHRLKLGLYPVMSLAEAREAWREARKEIAQGRDPSAKLPSMAFEAVFNEWIDKDQKDNRTTINVRRRIEYHVLGHWRGRSIADITRRDVVDVIDRPRDAGNTATAIQIHSNLSRLFKWAVNRGIIEASKNPMLLLERPGSGVKRDRVLEDRELAQVLGYADQLGYPFGHAIKLLIFTAARREEVWQLKWSEVRADEIHLAASRTKTSNLHIIPLSPAAVAVLSSILREGEYVFGGTGRPPASWSRIKRDYLDTDVKIAPWRIHDLRRTVATGLQKLGVPLPVTEAVLGHVSGSRAGVVGIYQRHDFAAEKRQALEAWADHVAGLTHDWLT
jgi:integrase